MSQQDRGTTRRSARRERAGEGERARAAARAADELKIYGDDEDAASPRARRGEKPSAAAKREPATESRLLKRRRRVGWFARIFGGSEESVGNGLHIFGRRISFWPIAIFVAVVLLLGVTFLESRNLTVDEATVTIVGLASDLEGYRILQLSDLNGRRFGDRQSTLLRAIDTLSYDAVFITGDMVGPGGDPEPFYELLEGLPSRKKVFFVAGDSDPGPYLSAPRAERGVLSELVLADWILGAIERGAIYVDAPMQVMVGSSGFWLSPASLLNLDVTASAATWKEQMEQEQTGVVSGIQADYNSLPVTSYRYQIAQKTLGAIEQMRDTDLHIVLSHVPPSSAFIQAAYSHNEEAEKYLSQPELILAGHYCGGVWRLPLLGAFYIPNSAAPRYGWFPAQEDVQGLSVTGETQMYISGGLSVCSDAPLMPFRLLNRPQISLLTLTATLPASMLEE